MAFFPGLASQLYTTLSFVAVLWLIYFAVRRRGLVPNPFPGE